MSPDENKTSAAAPNVQSKPIEVHRLHELADEAVIESRRPTWTAIRALAIVTGILIPVTACLIPDGATAFAFYMILLFPILLPIALGIIVLPERRQTAKQAAILEELAPYDDIRAIGPLLCLAFPNNCGHSRAATMVIPDQRIRRRAISAVTPLLYRLKDSDTSLMSRRDREILLDTLKNSHSLGRGVLACPEGEDMIIAMFSAVEELYTDSQLSSVLSHLKRPWAGVKPNRRVQIAIDECTARVRQRTEAARVEDTLVRPSADPSVPADILLRAASSGEIEPAEFLRPSSLK